MKLNIIRVLLRPIPCVVSTASFDCHRATGTDEKTIGTNRLLSEQDTEMAIKYHWLKGLASMGVAGEMEDTQRTCLRKRQACGSDSVSLRTPYRQQIQALDKFTIQSLNRLYNSRRVGTISAVFPARHVLRGLRKYLFLTEHNTFPDAFLIILTPVNKPA
ncbi:lysozyme inhibitor LprI family protein [Salmonella enterica]|uniref:lysozyme inhibitor LprI family protein n=1 Tax=Salmonella enterica TaxID=28901 RepID=UPI00159C3DD8|nr:hypothetical protein [Salmonella enterica]